MIEINGQITPITAKAGVVVKIPKVVGGATLHINEDGGIKRHDCHIFQVGNTKVISPNSFALGEEVVTKAVVIKTNDDFFVRLKPFNAPGNIKRKYRLNEMYNGEDNNLFLEI